MKKGTLAILALLIVGVVAAGAVSAFGFGGFGDRQAAQDAIKAGDYNAWKEAMISGLTEDRFNKVVERQENMPEWDGEMRGKMMQHNAEMQTALEAGDFDTWKALMEQSPREEPFELTQENFEKFTDMHNARMEGDLESAQALAEELGLPGPGIGRGGMGPGMGKGRHGGFGGEASCGGSCGGGCPYAAEVTE